MGSDEPQVQMDTAANGATPPEPAEPAAPAVTGGLPDLEGAGGAEGIDGPTELGADAAPEQTEADLMLEQALGARITVGGTTYDVGDLNLEDLEVLEDMAGVPFAEVDYGIAANLRTFVWLLMRHDEPDMKRDDCKPSLRELASVETAAEGLRAAAAPQVEHPAADPSRQPPASPQAAAERLAALEHPEPPPEPEPEPDPTPPEPTS